MPTIPPPPASSATFDATGILLAARRILFRLRSDPATAGQVDPAAAAAVTHDRHDAAGKAFAASVAAAAGSGSDDAAITAAIESQLLRGKPRGK